LAIGVLPELGGHANSRAPAKVYGRVVKEWFKPGNSRRAFLADDGRHLNEGGNEFASKTLSGRNAHH